MRASDADCVGLTEFNLTLTMHVPIEYVPTP